MASLTHLAISPLPPKPATPLPAPVPPHVAAEQAHALALLEAGKGHDALTKRAIAEGWSVNKLREQVEPLNAADFMLHAARLARGKGQSAPRVIAGEGDAASFIMEQYRVCR